jgi:hypothetical protein
MTDFPLLHVFHLLCLLCAPYSELGRMPVNGYIPTSLGLSAAPPDAVAPGRHHLDRRRARMRCTNQGQTLPWRPSTSLTSSRKCQNIGCSFTKTCSRPHDNFQLDKYTSRMNRTNDRANGMLCASTHIDLKPLNPNLLMPPSARSGSSIHHLRQEEARRPSYLDHSVAQVDLGQLDCSWSTVRNLPQKHTRLDSRRCTCLLFICRSGFGTDQHHMAFHRRQ